MSIIRNLVISLSLFAIYLLSTIYYPLPSNSAYAQTIDYNKYCSDIAGEPPAAEGAKPTFREPTYQELQKSRDQLTWVPDDRGNTGAVTVSDIKLPLVKRSADFLEGAVHDESYRFADLRTLSSGQLQAYFRPLQKLLPNGVRGQDQPISRATGSDSLKLRYVYHQTSVEFGNYDPATNQTILIEGTYQYANVCGQNPRTLKELVEVWGQPQPPSLMTNPTDKDWEDWYFTWASYWPKIPLAANDYSQGCVDLSRSTLPQIECPQPGEPNPPNRTFLRIGVPDVFRLKNLAYHVQRLLVPEQLVFPDCDPTNHPEVPCAPYQFTEKEGPEVRGGSNVKLYSPDGGLASSVTLSPQTADQSFVNSHFPFLRNIWTRLVGCLPVGDNRGCDTKTGGAYRTFFPDEEELAKKQYRLDTKVEVAASSNFPVWAGFVSGIENARKQVIRNLCPDTSGSSCLGVVPGF
ncbi:MAG TPA: hypothetical protein VIK81_04305 [Patescibacteria group bacterium]